MQFAAFNEAVDPSSLEGLNFEAICAVEAWNNNNMGRAKERVLTPPAGWVPPPPPPYSDALEVPEKEKEPVGKTAAVYPDPAGYQTSEFMLGSIAVGIILPESDGSIDPETEDWSSSRQSQVVSEIQAGLNWLDARCPDANLSFVYDQHLGVATGYEPINHPHTEAYLWINDVMDALGYSSGSSISRVRQYDNDLRSSMNTDWAITIFVVDSYNDPDCAFTDGWFAFAYRGGPYEVMTYDNEDRGIENMDACTAHETAHLFWAYDEYINDYGSCTQNINYLGVENGNYHECLTDNCLMKHAHSGYASNLICSYTSGQIGWRDTDGDHIPDILDTYPNTNLTVYSPDPTTDYTPTYRGTAEVSPLDNQIASTRPDLTLNTISNVQLRVNGGPWFDASPTDASFNSGSGRFLPSPPHLRTIISCWVAGRLPSRSEL